MRINLFSTSALALAAGLAIALTPVVAQAQPGGGRGPGGGGGMFGGGMFGGGMGGLTNAPVGKDDIAKMTKVLGLSADQQAAATALLDGYLASYQKKADEFRKLQEDAREAFRESRDFTVFTDLQPKMEEFRKFRADSEKQFMTDVQGVLDKKQAELWPKYERSHRREQSMTRGLMAGERADVISIVDRMQLPAPKLAQVELILDAYSMELDKAIGLRNAAQEEAMAGGGMMRNLFNPDGADPDAMKKAEEMIARNREASTTVRDINRKYARQVETTLGGAEGEKFAAEFRRASFPEIYRERQIDRAFAAALAIEGIDASQRDGINSLKEQYARDSKPVDQLAEQVAEEREANFSIQNMMNFRGGNESEKAQEQRRQRRELEDATWEKLKNILTPEQQAKLPERGGQGGGEGGGQRRMRGGNDGNNSGGDGARPGQQQRRQRGTPAAPGDANPPAPRN